MAWSMCSHQHEREGSAIPLQGLRGTPSSQLPSRLHPWLSPPPGSFVTALQPPLLSPATAQWPYRSPASILGVSTFELLRTVDLPSVHLIYPKHSKLCVCMASCCARCAHLAAWLLHWRRPRLPGWLLLARRSPAGAAASPARSSGQTHLPSRPRNAACLLVCSQSQSCMAHQSASTFCGPLHKPPWST